MPNIKVIQLLNMKKVAFALLAAGPIWQAASADEIKYNPDTGVPIPQSFVFPDKTPFEPFWAKRLTGYFKNRDGVRLHYSVLLPKADGKFPVILSINGYEAGSTGGLHYRKGMSAMGNELDRALLKAGYAVVGVNPAGTACSEGKWGFMDASFGRDGADAVNFITHQSWSNGNVGMANWSYGGSSQLATASNNPKGLKAIAPGMVLVDPRADTLAPGGVHAPGFVTGWRMILRGYWDFAAMSAQEDGDEACVKQVELNKAAEDKNSLATLMIAHPTRDAEMQKYSLLPGVPRINIPVLSIETWQDQSTGVRGGHYRDKLVDPNKLWLIQSNGGHDLYYSKALQQDLIKFYDRFVKGENNGFEQNTPRTRIWVDSSTTGTNPFDRDINTTPGWVIERGAIKESDLQPLQLFLGVNGQLSEKQADGNATAFDYPGKGVLVNSFEGDTQWGELPSDWKATSAAFTSAPIANDMFVYGGASADLWLTTTAGDADVQVTVTELRADGQEMYVQRGWLRLSNRALDEKASSPLRPVHADLPKSVQPLNPGQPIQARVEINKMGHYFRKGSRLRVWVDTPSDTGGFTFAPWNVKQKVYVLHTPKYQSSVRFGLLAGVQGPATSECGKVLLQPCRKDPLAGQ